MLSTKTSPLLAMGAIFLWGTLALLGVQLKHIPPFLLTGLALLVGSTISLPLSGFNLRAWKVPLSTLALGVYGLFGFHFLLFLALRTAPAVQANLLNYLWPLGMVLLAPVFLPQVKLKRHHVVAGLMGFCGAALTIAASSAASSDPAGIAAEKFSWGYVAALGSAFVWSSYSLLTKRVAAFPTAAIGLFAAVSGCLSLICHAFLEPSVDLVLKDCVLIALLGLGPLGAAFYLWDAALKNGDAQRIGLLSFLTPLLSTFCLLLMNQQWPSLTILAAALLIVAAALIGSLSAFQ